MKTTVKKNSNLTLAPPTVHDFYHQPPKLHLQIKQHPDTGEMTVLCRRSDGTREDASFYSLDHFLQAALVVETTVTEIKRHLSGLPPIDF